MNNQFPEDPIVLFNEWFQEAQATKTLNANAVSLATATKTGKPSVRIVLLKAWDERGFVFYTNLNSKKAKDLVENPSAALCCYWPAISKQIRIEGKAELVNEEEADHYFASRERKSQIVTWASEQSHVMQSPEELQNKLQHYLAQFGEEGLVPRPKFWSGFRIVPDLIEFWKSGDYRLHERVVYKKTAQKTWNFTYLYP